VTVKLALGIALAASAIAGTGILAAAAPAQRAAARDWAKSVTLTPDGGYRIGNPAAPVKLIEYGSLTCDHCAHFAEQGFPQLVDKYVRPGKVSFEFRNFVRDPADLAAAILSRCAAPANYFSLTDRYFRSQSEWLGRFQSMTDDQAKAIAALPAAERVARFASFAGLDKIAAQDGVAAAKAQTCLSNRQAAEKLAQMRKVAVEQHGLKGTPTFLINGSRAPAHDWSSLEPLLQPPGG
jgi:protein-disulfide isomerase